MTIVFENACSAAAAAAECQQINKQFCGIHYVRSIVAYFSNLKILR